MAITEGNAHSMWDTWNIAIYDTGYIKEKLWYNGKNQTFAHVLCLIMGKTVF